MTHGWETLQDEKEAGAHEGFAFDLLWLWPVLLLKAIVEVFSGHAQRLKALRKADRRIAEGRTGPAMSRTSGPPNG
jgi:hypothetical protein